VAPADGREGDWIGGDPAFAEAAGDTQNRHQLASDGTEADLALAPRQASLTDQHRFPVNDLSQLLYLLGE